MALTEPFPGFAELCPQPIVYRSTWHMSLAEHTEEGLELIVLDHSLRLPVQRYHHNFMAAHECAHHLLGHTTPEGLVSRRTELGVMAQQELAADCWAAEFLGLMGREAEAKQMAESFYRRGQAAPGAGYPDGYARAQTVSRCLRAGRAGRLAGASAPRPLSVILAGFD